MSVKSNLHGPDLHIKAFCFTVSVSQLSLNKWEVKLVKHQVKDKEV